MKQQNKIIHLGKEELSYTGRQLYYNTETKTFHLGFCISQLTAAVKATPYMEKKLKKAQ